MATQQMTSTLQKLFIDAKTPIEQNATTLFLPRKDVALWRAEFNVLLVDDNRPSLDLMSEILTRLGCMVTLADNGKEAWAQFQKVPYSVVISDYVMPEISGLELCKRTKRVAPSTFFFLITGKNTDFAHYARAYAAGVDDFLFKPADFNVIRNKLQFMDRQLKVNAVLAAHAPDPGNVAGSRQRPRELNRSRSRGRASS